MNGAQRGQPSVAGIRISPRLADILARMVEAKLAPEGASQPPQKDGNVRRPPALKDR
jgi:hypothetical protein